MAMVVNGKGSSGPQSLVAYKKMVLVGNGRPILWKDLTLGLPQQKKPWQSQGPKDHIHKRFLDILTLGPRPRMGDPYVSCRGLNDYQWHGSTYK